ncbi:hypothetical protein PI125_g16871 [Phytophthora idaei]|nr:hypothetical protein PI125_g16871 [Phytophthora idaei]KAG3140846.1 hypothetical protein PI126_g15802 [Phytophthora idaei]
MHAKFKTGVWPRGRLAELSAERCCTDGGSSWPFTLKLVVYIAKSVLQLKKLYEPGQCFRSAQDADVWAMTVKWSESQKLVLNAM